MDLISRPAAILSTLSSVSSPATVIPVRAGRPLVRVPVLSNSATLTAAAASSTSPPLAMRPADEADVRAAAWGICEASNREQGHETTQRRRVVIRASSVLPCTRNDSIGASTRTMGTQNFVKVSIEVCVLVGLSLYCLTISTRLDSLVSSPIASALRMTGPLTSVRPASTKSPSLIDTGTGSPVSGALSIDPAPSTTIPSTGTVSPDLTSTRSPLFIACTGVISSS